MEFTTMIATRYLFSKKSKNAVNIITIVSMAGIAVGVFALFVVLSVFAGLKEVNLSLLSNFDPDIKVSAAQGKSFTDNDTLISHIKSIPGVQTVSRTLQDKVFVTYKGLETVTLIKGVDENFTTLNGIDTCVFIGKWLQKSYSEPFQIVVGGTSAQSLNLSTEDYAYPLRIYYPDAGTSALNPERAFRVTAAVASGLFYLKDYDDKYMLSDLGAAQQILGKEQKISALEIKLAPGISPETTARKIKEALGGPFKVETRREQHSLFFRMMNTENAVLYAVFTLILIIALFNLVGSVAMLIVDKKQNIVTLSHLGADRATLRLIFMKEGMLICLIGGALGLAAAAALTLFQQHFEFFTIEGTYALPYPVRFTFGNFALVGTTVVICGYIAARISVCGISRVTNKE